MFWDEVLDVLVVPQTQVTDRMFVCCSCVRDLIADFSQALGLYKSLRFPVLTGGPARADLHTTTIATMWRTLRELAHWLSSRGQQDKVGFFVPLCSVRTPSAHVLCRHGGTKAPPLANGVQSRSFSSAERSSKQFPYILAQCFSSSLLVTV